MPVHLAYVDESGDTGATGSRTYVLACLLVRSSQWADAFDGIIGFRRFLKSRFDLPVRAEIKANYLLHNSSEAFRRLELSERARHFIYRGLMQLQPKLGLSSFAVVINKRKLRAGTDPLDYAWTYVLQRLETLSRKGHDEAIVMHDEGETEAIRKIARRARRFGSSGSLFGGSRRLPFKGLIDDPVPKNSRQSYFLQLADLSAYAAFRRCFPPPPRRVQVVHTGMWDELRTARYAKANMRVPGPSSGIVLWPR